MGRRVDLADLSDQLANELKRFEQGELSVTPENIDRLREMEKVLKRQRLAYKELYVYVCHQMDEALELVDDKIVRLESELPDFPDRLFDSQND